MVVKRRAIGGGYGWWRESLGPDKTRGRCSHLSPNTDIVDTVGAGDSFQAALLSKLVMDGNGDPGSTIDALEASSLDKLVTFAISAASATCSRRGADLPRLNEIVGRSRKSFFGLVT